MSNAEAAHHLDVAATVSAVKLMSRLQKQVTEAWEGRSTSNTQMKRRGLNSSDEGAKHYSETQSLWDKHRRGAGISATDERADGSGKTNYSTKHLAEGSDSLFEVGGNRRRHRETGRTCKTPPRE